MRKKKHIGSSFEDFLKEEGIFEETTTQAVKRVLSWQISHQADAYEPEPA
jgi:antitoxin HicB